MTGAAILGILSFQRTNCPGYTLPWSGEQLWGGGGRTWRFRRGWARLAPRDFDPLSRKESADTLSQRRDLLLLLSQHLHDGLVELSVVRERASEELFELIDTVCLLGVVVCAREDLLDLRAVSRAGELHGLLDNVLHHLGSLLQRLLIASLGDCRQSLRQRNENRLQQPHLLLVFE